MAFGDVIVKSTFEAIAHYQDGTHRLFGCLTSTGISKTVEVEDIRCGVDWTLKTILQLSSDMTVTVSTAVWDDYVMELQSGSDFSLNQTVSVWKYEKVLFTVSTTNATATITGTPVGGIVKVQDQQKTLYPATFATSTVTATGAATTLGGKYGYVMYQESTTADVLVFETDTLPTVFGLTLHGIAFDPETNLKVADLYFDFPRVQSDGAMELALAGGTNTQTEITLRVLPNAGEFGKYIVEPVA